MFVLYSLPDNTATFYEASEKGQLDIVQRLLRTSTDVNEARPDVSDVSFHYVMTQGI